MKNRIKIHDDWETPRYILDDIKKEFGNFFDPCPLHANFDGLVIPWDDVNFINPPYNRKDKEDFIRKSYQESLKGKICILLIPAVTDTIIFHDLILPHAEIRFIKGRISFKGYNSKGVYTDKGKGQSGSMLVILGGKHAKNNKQKL